MDKGVANTIKDHKQKHDDDDDDDDYPPGGPNQGSKTGKSASAKELVEELIVEVVMDNEGEDVVRDDDQPQDTSEPKKRKTPNQDWFKQPPRPPTPDPKLNKHKLGWKNSKGDRYPFDLSKRLPLQGHLGHLTVTADYFFNNDLKYLKSSDPERTYTTSIMKIKAARYEIKGIEGMVPMLWSPTKFSKHNVYSTKKILGVKSVSVKKLHGYGHLEEIVVKRADYQLYKFKEGDFVDLHLNDIEDMLLLTVQHKLFHLTDNDIVDLIVALSMFTRSLVIKKRVGDIQLGVESCKKKLNIIPPQQTFLEIIFKELYTPSHKPPGVIYEDLDELHHRVLDFDLGYNKEMLRRKWTAIDKKRSELMVELIDKQMHERRIIRNLERLVGARELEMDYKLMTRTSVSVNNLHGYGHLEEIVVKRANRQLYKFKEGDFMDLHLNDIEDMLLLAVHHKLFHLTDNDIVDFIVALRMFTRSLIIKKRVEDLQLGVEGYQKKLNITPPQQTFPEIEFKELYTPSYKPPGVIYEHLVKQKRVMRADELYKFSDGTPKKVQDELHHRLLNFDLGYNKEMRRKWTAIDKKRSKLMVELIDKQMREKRIIRNLKRLVSARELETD
ncbi:hypothetical protein Tco_0404212 [Tanacetum coccineum]